MTASVWTGPLIVTGPMMGSPGTSRDYTYESGPSAFYMGQGIPDQRFVPLNKDNLNTGTQPGHWDGAQFCAVNFAPATLGAALIVAAATATSGTAMTLAAAAAGITTAVPFVAYSGAIVTSGITLDFGFDAVNVTAGSKTATPAGSMENYRVGQRVVVANVGNAGATTALLTFVTAVGASTITLNDAPAATNSAARIGAGNQIYEAGAFPKAPTGATPTYVKGPMAWLDAQQNLCRGVSVTSNNASDTGWTVTVVGYDMYGQPQTEAIAMTANTVTYGSKTWKHITSVTPTNTGSTVGTISVGTSDLFGLAYRSLLWEFTNVFWAGAVMATSVGWTAGATAAASTTTADPRGTIQISTGGPGTGITASPSNGTRRLVVFQRIKLQDMVNQSDQAGTFQTLYGNVPV